MQSTTSAEVTRSFATLREMLVDRGLDTTSLATISDADVLALSATKNVFHVDVRSCGMRIVYNMNPKFKNSDVKKLLTPSAKKLAGGAEDDDDAAAAAEPEVAAAETTDADAEDGFPSQVIVVVREKPAQGKGVDELARDIHLFPIKELQYNVSRHGMVPRHEPVRNEAEILAVLARYRLKSRFQLPLILSSDPMARYLALKPGQLVRITRPSPSAGTYVLYRCCS
jgi:DNA-directed RNA polymerase subunit H (RpoH/RPB5)